MQELITPCLWFNGQAQEAGKFYSAHFKDTRISTQTPVVTEITVSGQHITLLDGGPQYSPNPSISLFYICTSEEEIDRIWEAFSREGEILMPLDNYPWSNKYGWINDKYGVSWQLSLGEISEVGQKVTPCLMFTRDHYGQAEEAMNVYAGIFKYPMVDGILRYDANEQPEEEGKVKHAQMALAGQKFMFMESAQPHAFTFSEGVSLVIHCETQEEIDHYWEALTDRGEESMCGWLKDRFGVSWQVIPNVLGKLMSNPSTAGRATEAFLKMRKLDIAIIVAAVEE